jgi:kinesin family protein 4/21/27
MSRDLASPGRDSIASNQSLNAALAAQALADKVALEQEKSDIEAKLRQVEKHLAAEKQLTATLEEALEDLETQSKKVKGDADAWRKRAGELEAARREADDERRKLVDTQRKLENQLTEAKAREIERQKAVDELERQRRESSATMTTSGGSGGRWSLNTVTEGSAMHSKNTSVSEQAAAQRKLEERMAGVQGKRKKKGSLNCF